MLGEFSTEQRLSFGNVLTVVILSFQNTRIWTVNTHLLLKEWEQKKETLLSTKSAA